MLLLLLPTVVHFNHLHLLPCSLLSSLTHSPLLLSLPLARLGMGPRMCHQAANPLIKWADGMGFLSHMRVCLYICTCKHTHILCQPPIDLYKHSSTRATAKFMYTHTHVHNGFGKCNITRVQKDTQIRTTSFFKFLSLPCVCVSLSLSLT